MTNSTKPTTFHNTQSLLNFNSSLPKDTLTTPDLVYQTANQALFTLLSSFDRQINPSLPSDYRSTSDLISAHSAHFDIQTLCLIRSLQAGARFMDSQTSEPHVQYHNRTHFVQALASVSMLSEHEFSPNQVYEKLLALNTMLFHDLGHDGGTNTIVPPSKLTQSEPGPSRLERLAFDLCQPILEQQDVCLRDQRIIEQCILNTDPSVHPQTKQQYQGLKQPAQKESKEHLITRISAICNDADVLYSLLPQTGFTLGQRLSEEWKHIDHPQAANCASFQGRLGFLRFFQPISQAAQNSGLTSLVNQQIQAFSKFAPQVSNSEPQIQDVALRGAQYLDQFATNLSQKNYLKALSIPAPQNTSTIKNIVKL